jgi:DNA-binding response OmpR family regulator
MLPSSNPLVLVADDEPSMLELVARHLKTMEDPKLEVMEASDGDQAWHLAREHLPDLVVLDVMMPGMSGWEVCRKIREDVALAHTGVVMLTGIGENLNQMTSPLYGADAYIDKPFEFDELDEKVKNALSARAAQRDAVARPSPSGPSLGDHDHGDDVANVNGVAGPAQAAPKKAAPKKAPKKKAAKKIAGKAKSPAKKGSAKKKSGPTKKGTAPKAKTAARTRAKGTKSLKPKHNKKEDTKMAAKKGAKKAAKKTAAKKTAKKGAKKKAK